MTWEQPPKVKVIEISRNDALAVELYVECCKDLGLPIPEWTAPVIALLHPELKKDKKEEPNG